MTSVIEELDTIGDDPVWRKIENALRDRITHGAWPPGQALPSRRQLCADFRTTRVTLDKAIHGLVVEGLLSSSKGSGTYVSDPDDPKRGRRTDSPRISAQQDLRIGVVLGLEGPVDFSGGVQVDSFYVGSLLSGVGAGAAGREVAVTYAQVADGNYLRFFRESALDGLVLIAPQMRDLPELRRLAGAEIPFVVVSTADADLPGVGCDNKRAAEAVVQHLLDLGHTQIALVSLALSHSDHLDRLEGYLRGMAAARVRFDPRNMVLNPAYDADAFEAIVDDWLTGAVMRGHVPTAIVCCDFRMALVTQGVLRQHGLRVPEDVSLVGFDDPISAEHLTPPLTTVRLPVYQVGRRAVERLIEHLLSGPDAAPLYGVEILPSELVVRESSKPPATASANTDTILTRS